MDNALVNNPDPVSSHYMPGNYIIIIIINISMIYIRFDIDGGRFEKDFASYDKQVREQ